MKIINFFLTLLLFASSATTTTAQTTPQCMYTPTLHQPLNVSPPPDKEPFIHASGRAGIERYLARAINMDDLVKTAYPLTTSPNLDCTGGDPCEGTCKYDQYCCQRYQDDIDMLAYLNAGYIFNVTGYYGPERAFVRSEASLEDQNPDPQIDPPNKFRVAAKQLVDDINKAYDNNNLRRPIIDGFMQENIDRPDLIHEIIIPRLVLQFFFEQMSVSEKLHYFNGGLFDSPKSGIPFNKDLMCWILNGTDTYYVDVNKLQGRMYLFFVCKQFIDMGFTSMNLSQSDYFFFHDGSNLTIPEHKQKFTQNEKEADNALYGDDVKKGYFNLSTTLDMLRQYAASKGKFMLFWNQSDRVYYKYKDAGNGNYVKDLTPDGKFKYMWDFNSSAMRPREVDDNHQNTGRNLVRTNKPYLPTQRNMTIEEFDQKIPGCHYCNTTGVVDPSCNRTIQNLRALPDPGSGVNYERNAAGNSTRPWINQPGNQNALPNGREFQNLPTIVYVDGGSGILTSQQGAQLSGDPNTNRFRPYSFGTSEGTSTNEGTWSYDDARWWYEFMNQFPNDNLNQTCTMNWIDYNYQNVKKFGYFGSAYETNPPINFLIIAGRALRRWVVTPSIDVVPNIPPINISGGTGPYHKLSSKTTVLNYLKENLWKANEVTNASILVDIDEVGTLASQPCHQEGYCRYWPQINLQVAAPDKSSIYTWHIKYEDGTWEEMTYGAKRTFIPRKLGVCTVYLVQDNLGLPSVLNGEKTVFKELNITLSTCLPCEPWAAKKIESELPVASTNYESTLLGNIPGKLILESTLQVDRYITNDGKKDEFDVAVYPSPTNGIVNLDFKAILPDGVWVKFYNSAGILLFEKRYSSSTSKLVQFDMGDYASGVYFFQISAPGGSVLKKVVRM